MDTCCIGKFNGGYIYELAYVVSERDNFILTQWGFLPTLEEVLKEAYKLERVYKRNFEIKTLKDDKDNALDEKELEFCFEKIGRLRKQNLTKIVGQDGNYK